MIATFHKLKVHMNKDYSKNQTLSINKIACNKLNKKFN